MLSQLRDILKPNDITVFGIAGLFMLTALSFSVVATPLMQALPLRPIRDLRREALRPFRLSEFAGIAYLVGISIFAAGILAKLA